MSPTALVLQRRMLTSCDRQWSLYFNRPFRMPERYRSLMLSLSLSSMRSDYPTDPHKLSQSGLLSQLLEYQSFVYSPGRRAEYDPIKVENLSVRFHCEFLPKLPERSVLNSPNTFWDNDRPALVKQRALLHILIHTFLSNLFGSSLYAADEDVLTFSSYKRQLLTSHLRQTSAAAAKVVGYVAGLHDYLGGRQTKLFHIPFYGLQAASLLAVSMLQLSNVPLLSLPKTSPYSHNPTFNDDQDGENQSTDLTVCFHSYKAILEDLLLRFGALREVSPMADSCYDGLNELCRVAGESLARLLDDNGASRSTTAASPTPAAAATTCNDHDSIDYVLTETMHRSGQMSESEHIASTFGQYPPESVGYSSSGNELASLHMDESMGNCLDPSMSEVWSYGATQSWPQPTDFVGS